MASGGAVILIQMGLLILSDEKYEDRKLPYLPVNLLTARCIAKVMKCILFDRGKENLSG